MSLFFFDLSYEPCVVFDPDKMSFEYPVSATARYGTYHSSKIVAVFGAIWT